MANALGGTFFGPRRTGQSWGSQPCTACAGRTAAQTTRRVGVGLSIYLITGIDSETDEDLDSTVRLIQAIRPHDGLVSPLTIYPGTALCEEAKARGDLTDDYWARDRREAYYAREDAWTRRSVRTLMSTLRGVGRAAAYGEADFEQQREIVGDCYALRLSAGEYWQRRGALGRAREEYLAKLDKVLSAPPSASRTRPRTTAQPPTSRRPSSSPTPFSGPPCSG